MQFDVVLTNPPFQDSVNRKKTPHKLWIDFTMAVFDRLLSEGGDLIQVSPASFSSPSNVVLSLMGENQTMVVRFDNEHHFPEIASTFADYWVKKIPNDSRPTVIVKSGERFAVELDGRMAYLPNDLSKHSLAIHSKVMFGEGGRLPVEWDYVTAHNIRRYGDEPTLVEVRDESHTHPVFHTNRSTWWSSIRQEWASEKKVMWTRSGYTKPFYDAGVHGGTDMVYYVRVASDDEGNNLAANLNSQLMHYVFRTARWSGFGNERVFVSLPDMPRDRSFSDYEMCDFFQLTTEEVEYLQRIMEPRGRKAR